MNKKILKQLLYDTRKMPDKKFSLRDWDVDPIGNHIKRNPKGALRYTDTHRIEINDGRSSMFFDTYKNARSPYVVQGFWAVAQYLDIDYVACQWLFNIERYPINCTPRRLHELVCWRLAYILKHGRRKATSSVKEIKAS